MDPPQLVPEGELDKKHGKIISTDEDGMFYFWVSHIDSGNIKINEEPFNVVEAPSIAEEDRNNNGDGLEEELEVPRSEANHENCEPTAKQRRLRE